MGKARQFLASFVQTHTHTKNTIIHIEPETILGENWIYALLHEFAQIHIFAQRSGDCATERVCAVNYRYIHTLPSMKFVIHVETMWGHRWPKGSAIIQKYNKLNLCACGANSYWRPFKVLQWTAEIQVHDVLVYINFLSVRSCRRWLAFMSRSFMRGECSVLPCATNRAAPPTPNTHRIADVYSNSRGTICFCTRHGTHTTLTHTDTRPMADWLALLDWCRLIYSVHLI